MKLLTFLSLLLISQLCLANENNTLSFGIVPQQSNEKIAQLWRPILERISKETSLVIEFKPAKDIRTFQKMLNNGEFDLAYMNPYQYVRSHKSKGYKAIAKSKFKTIKGILVTHKDQKIKKVSELNNTQLAFASPKAFAASMLVQHHLLENNVNYTANYVLTHDAVYKAVAEGTYRAGGGVVRTLKNTDPEIKKQLRISWISEGYTPHAIAYGSTVNREDALAIQSAFVTISNKEEGKALVKKLNMKAFTAASNTDWDDVRKLLKDSQ